MSRKLLNFIFSVIVASTVSYLHADAQDNDEATSAAKIEVVDSDVFSVNDQLIAQSKKKKRRKKRQQHTEAVDSWKFYGIHHRYLVPPQNFFVSTDIGVGFLYFSGTEGNFQLYNTLSNNVGQRLFLAPLRADNQLAGRLGYNRTPQIEVQLGLRFKHWASCSVSYLHQGSVYIQTAEQLYRPAVGDIGAPAIPRLVGNTFRSTVALDAILFKFYFNLPLSLVWKTVSYNPYLGFGIGPGWQTWAHNTVVNNVYEEFAAANTFVDSNCVSFKQKVSANAVWSLDLGLALRSVIPIVNFSVKFGTKFVGWGQARQIGVASQNRDATLTQMAAPFRVKYVYSFAPYMGFQLNF